METTFMSIFFRLVAAAVLSVLLGAPAGAHHIWILPDADGKPVVHFGEFAENLKEVSPGLLDRIEVTARLVSPKGETPLEAKRGANGIILSGSTGPAKCILAEDPRAPVRERKSGEQVIRSVYHPAARFVGDLRARQPVFTLDIVPTSQPGRFQVVFRGTPLANAKVSIMAASGWEREVRADQTGIFEAAFPWKGSYVIQVSHPDPTPGSRGGESFELTNFVTTLSLVRPTGLDPLPPPPAAKPNASQG
jgi:hypothetical protein